MNKRILIVPIARISNTKRIETSIAEDGTFNCIHAIEGIPLQQFENIYFVITKKCIAHYKFDMDLFITQLAAFDVVNCTKSKLVILQNETCSQAETIVSALIQLKIFENMSVLCKDGDSFFHINNESISGNKLMIYNVEDCDIVDPKHKSYVSVDMNNVVTNTIEKTIISKYFNCGGYFFSNVRDFIRAYEELLVKYNESPRMSNIVQYLMLYKNKTFAAIKCDEYKDFNINKQ